MNLNHYDIQSSPITFKENTMLEPNLGFTLAWGSVDLVLGLSLSQVLQTSPQPANLMGVLKYVFENLKENMQYVLSQDNIKSLSVLKIQPSAH